MEIIKVVTTTLNLNTGERSEHELNKRELKKWKKEHGIEDDNTKKEAKPDT